MLLRNHSKIQVLLLALVVLTGCLAAGPVLAGEKTFTVMTGTTDVNDSFIRLIRGAVTVVRENSTETIPFEGAYVTFTIDAPGTTHVTFSGQGANGEYAGRRITFEAAETGTPQAFDTTERILERSFPVGVGGNPDGTYHLDYIFSNMFWFMPADPLGPIMGISMEDPDWTDQYFDAPTFSLWHGWHHTNGATLRRAWSFGDTQGYMPGIIVNWIYPDGQTVYSRYYPGLSVGYDDDGTFWWTQQGVDLVGTRIGLIYRLRIAYSPAFLETLPEGIYTIIFQLEDPTGDRSNIRIEMIQIEKDTL